jgi:thioesterase domain-containing protein
MTAWVSARDAPAAGPTDSSTAPAPNGARLQRLRAGQANEILFLVPGVEADLSELTTLVSVLAGPQEIYAVAPLPEDAQQRPVHGMERMAQLMVAAIRQVQPAGPYRLGGYSFGGLAALEMAHQLRTAGEVVEALFLIEAVYDERYWPRAIWRRAMVRRTGWQLARIMRMPPTRAIGELRLRAGRLIQRLMRRRRAAAPDPLRVQTSDEAIMAPRAYAAMAGYRPSFYDGPMTLIASLTDRHFGCDTARIWAGYADRLEVRRVLGDHLTIMREPAAASAVARVIDHRLARMRDGWTGLRPMTGFERPMILTTVRWFAAARLAHALTEAGFSVSACRPRAHPIKLVDGLASDHMLNRLARLRSLATAIGRAKPDIILPDDEPSLVLLRRLYAKVRKADPEMAALIACSLGDLAYWPSIASRTALATEARRLDISAPVTDVVATAAALTGWAAGQNLPVVLKTDGSWGGRGVAVVRDASHLRRAWRAISGPPSLVRAVKRMVFDLEAGPLAAWARRVAPVVNVQQFVEGREAIATVACVNGTVHALVCLEVVQATAAKGPAAAVRIIDHPAMREAARRLVARFALSGFCGFDFIITDTGEARLLELNPRVTPTAHLLVEGDRPVGRTITLFPALFGEPESAATGALDVPVRAPALVQHGDEMTVHVQRPIARWARRTKRRLTNAYRADR